MDNRIEELITAWHKRNIQGIFFPIRAQAVEAILQRIPPSATVGLSGSVTLDELGIVKILESRGFKVINQYKPGISREESLELRMAGSNADYYLTGVNAISQNGELVFFSAYGNRPAGISYAKNVIVVSGINKLTADIGSAIKRAREQATPLNCKRLSYQTPCFADGICRQEACLFPDYKRMCCQILIIEAEISPGRLSVILIDEKLGF